MADRPIWFGDDFDPQVRRAAERLARAPEIEHVVVMPDAHPGPALSNGLVVGSSNWLLPAAVGNDIGCGYATIALDWTGDHIARLGPAILRALQEVVPTRRFPRRVLREPWPDGLSPERPRDRSLQRWAATDGWLELGTLGGGNHFFEVQLDADDRVWLLVHSGSRGVGQQIALRHIEAANQRVAGVSAIEADSSAGLDYLNDLAWARAYAAESRHRMLRGAVTRLANFARVEADSGSQILSDHNHVQLETHAGRLLWVHRKGANHVGSGTDNIIPGSMGTHTYHVEGRGNERALDSSSHGAGRQVSRGAARQRIPRRAVQAALQTVLHQPRARLCEEAPQAYKDLDRVMRQQRKLVRIRRRLTPVISHKE